MGEATTETGLRESIAVVLRTTPARGAATTLIDHTEHRYNAGCALCRSETDTLADALLPLLQPVGPVSSVWHVEAGCDGRWRPVAGPFPTRAAAVTDLEWRRTTAHKAVAHRLTRTDTTRTTTIEEDT